jgi:hypothetical protein
MIKCKYSDIASKTGWHRQTCLGVVDHRQRGITLLLTLMVLVILAVVIVQFQADAALQIRSGSYRLERQQCRYAAESAIIVAARLIEQELKGPVSTLDEGLPEEETTARNLPDPNLDDETYDYDFEENQLTDKPHFVMLLQNMDIGGADVNIEVYDENAKWPLFWLVRSPYDSRTTNTQSRNAFYKYAAGMDVRSADASRLSQLVNTLGDSLNLPPAPVIITKSSRSQSLSRRGRRIEYVERIAQEETLQKVMGAFATRWRDYLRENPDLEPVREPLKDMPGTFSDYISMWGANYINLNTASAEVLETAFEPLGLTKRQVQAIVEYRRQTPFTNTGQLTNVPGISPTLSNNMRDLCVIKSRTFSVHVEARYGRARYRLMGGLYADHRNRLQKSAVFSGD